MGTIDGIVGDASEDSDLEDADAVDDELAEMQKTFIAAVRSHMSTNDDLTR